MNASELVGAVGALWRFPVKSMGGEQIEEAELSGRGIAGDRAYALIDADTGKVVSAKSVKRFPNMLNCRATFVEPPVSGSEPPPVRIVLPSGVTVTSDSSDVERVLSEHFKRNVTLAKSAPDDFTIDMYHPDVEDLDPTGRRDVVVDQKLGSAFFAERGLPSPVAAGSFFDLFPISVLTTSSLNRLNQLQPQSRFDQRRFRMNVIVNANETGFVENSWIGRELAIGEAVRLRVVVPDSRCVMTTLAQDDLPKDIQILRALARHNKIQVADAGQFA
ncbi:MAG: MOSC domain-containing protein, partial [Pyrinomonadaceae bacterium]